MATSRIILALEPTPGPLGKDLVARDVDVVRIYSPDEVVDALDRGPADLCVVHAADPRMDEVLHQLRASPAGAVLPVLLIGGPEASVSDRERALELGADAYVGTDEGHEEVLARVEMLLGRPSADPGLPFAPSDPIEEALAAAEAVAPPTETGPTLDDPAKMAVGAASMQQIIDQVEARISAAPPIDTGTVDSPGDGDPLAALDIEADLGRPAHTDSEPPVAEPGERAAPDDVQPADAGAEADDELESEREETLVYVPESEDEPTLPGTPAGVSAAAEHERVDDEPDEEITLTSAPVDQPFEDLELDEGDRSAIAEPPVAEVAPDGLDRGGLDQEPLWSLLARALAEKQSGAFLLSSRGIERKVFLDGGEPVMAVSSAREDRLIELLYREGRLSEDQYQQAVMTIGASGRRAGVILMEKGLIAPRELFPLVRHHYETLIFDAFTWREGEWRFDPQQLAAGERILLDVPAGALIVEGLRLRATSAEIDALILPGAMPFRVEEGICPLEKIDLPPEELGLVEACDGTRTTHDLASGFGMTEVEVRTLLAGLVVLGWIRPIGGDDTGKPLQAQVFTPATAASDVRVERARVADKLSQVEEGTYFAIMEISREASGYEIRKAYRRLRGQFAPERFAVSELADLQPEVEVIRFVLDEAYEVLRNPAIREAYRQAIGAG